jgi:hypothetical protein
MTTAPPDPRENILATFESCGVRDLVAANSLAADRFERDHQCVERDVYAGRVFGG